MDRQNTSPSLIDQAQPLDVLLRQAMAADLSALADTLTDNGRGRVSLKEETKKIILLHKRQQTLHTIAPLLATEICAFGGNTVANAFRQKKAPTYAVVALGVAKRIGAKVNKNASVAEIERAIIEKTLLKALKGGKKEEMQALLKAQQLTVDHAQISQLLKEGKADDVVRLLITSCGPYAVSRMVNAAMLPALNLALKAGLPTLGKVIAGRAPTLLNPIAAVLSAAWMTYDLTGPAWRVTIPAVIRIACIRQADIQQQADTFCMELKQCL